jgi:hypothetical protein
VKLLTHNHGLLAYWLNNFLNRKLKTNIQPIYATTGAILPDVFIILNFFFPSETLITASKCFHSIPIFGILFLGFILGQKFHYGRTMAFFLGWGFFHIAVDVMTHKNKAWPYLWPWLNYPIHGVADHDNLVLLGIEAILTIYILYRLLIILIDFLVSLVD